MLSIPLPDGRAIAVECAHEALIATAELNAHPRNPNTHSDKQVALLAKIIMHQGWRAPVVVSNLSGYVVAGHARILAAKLLGLQSVPVDHQDFSNEADEIAHMIADNRIAEFASMDRGMLKDLLLDLDSGAFDLSLTGFSEQDLASMIPAAHNANDLGLKYSVVIECADETQQVHLMKEFEERNLPCRALIL